MEKGVLRFAGYELDERKRELRRDGTAIHLEPQVFDVLAHLATHRNRVVTKIELFDEVWGSRFVSESALTSRIKSARQAVGDDGRTQSVIRTVHGSGYRFVADVGDGTGPQATPVDSSPLVGRAFHRERLEQRFAEAAAGSRRTVFVTGEAGIGKTTLVDDFVARFVDGDVLVSHGRCLDHGPMAEPYLPIIDALARLCRGPAGEGVVDMVATAAPSWLLQMPSLVTPDRVDDLRARSLGASSQRMQRELIDVFEVLATDTTLVLVLEDLQWADEPTANFLEHLARRTDDARLLIVGTHRAAGAGDASRLLSAAQHLVVEGVAEELRLDRLNVDEVAIAVAAVLPGLDRDVIGLLHERTAGVPLFVRDLATSWVSSGVLEPLDTGKMAPAIALEELAGTVPPSVPVLVERELGRLPPGDVALLEAAAAVGLQFSSAAVAALVGCDEEDAEARCAALARGRQFIEPDGVDEWPDGTVSGRFRFVHQLHHEVLYARVPPGRRARYHVAAGHRLEQAYGEQAGEHVGELATHFDRGHDAARASDYLARAAEQAIVRGAYPEALAHIDAALAHVARLAPGGARDGQELELQLARGSALIPTHGWTSPELEAAYGRALELCDSLDDPAAHKVATVALATVREITGRHLESQALLRPVLGSAIEVMAVETRELLACAAFHQGRFQSAIEHAREGLAAFRADAPNELYARFGIEPAAFCSAWLAFSSWFLGEEGEAAAYMESVMQLERTRPYALASASVLTASFHQYRGDPDQVMTWCEQAIALATEQGFPFPLAEAHVFRGWARSMNGDADEGLLELVEGVSMYEAAGERTDLPHYFGMHAEALLRLGRSAEAVDRLDDALTIVRRTPGYFYEPELHRLRAAALMAMGTPSAEADARAALDTGLAQAEAQGSVALRTRIVEALDQSADHSASA